MERLHPGIKGAFVIGAILPSIIGGAILFFFGFIIYLIIYKAIFNAEVTIPVKGIITYAAVFIVIVYVWAIIYNFMAFNRFGYELRQDGIYIESGVIGKKYNFVPYSKVQNIDISRGLFARIFGYSELCIQTAGYSGYMQRAGYPGSVAEAVIPSVEPQRAEQIRDFILKKSKE